MCTFKLKIRSAKKNDFSNKKKCKKIKMRKIDCCICLDENVCHYTDEDIKSKCEHPVCKNCYFQLPKEECPLCRTEIRSLIMDIKKAIYHVLNVRYEKLFGDDVSYVNILFVDTWGYDFIIILRRRRPHPRMKRPRYEIEQYYYLENRFIEKDIHMKQKVSPQICK